MGDFSQWQTALSLLKTTTLSFIDISSNLRIMIVPDLDVPTKKSAIDRMMAEIKLLRASIDLATANLRKAAVVIDNIINLPTTLVPINTLPDEVLYHIFNITIMTPSPSGNRSFKERNMTLAISSVCARWRRFALRIPSFWSYIDLRNIRKINPQRSQPLDLTKSWLERSKGSPIHLSLPCGSVNIWQARNLILALQPYGPSICSIVSDKLGDSLLIQELYTLCSVHGSPDSTKTLVIVAQSKQPEPRVSWQPVTSFTGLVNFELSWLPPTAYPTSNQVATILASNQSIRRLRLQSMCILLEADRPIYDTILPSLQLLDVSDLEGFPWLMGILLPGTLELDLRLSRHHCHPANSAVLSRFLDQAHVVSLWISDSRSNPDTLWLPVLPDVRVLGLIAPWDSCLSFVKHLVVHDREAAVARYSTVRKIFLSGSESMEESGRARVEK
ncbi:hypothetical protein FRC12_011477 [Ceratobasidium sp. 428]|nr:hypothetical protein FRC12_011477 [Ceratobasidium sp. 428]